MVITIYDKLGTVKAEIAPDDSSTQVKEIQGDNVLTLSFTHYGHIVLDVDDYVDFEGERYWLQEAYRPMEKSTLEWEYNLKLYGVESLLKNFLVLKQIDGEEEPVFTLTAPAREHVAMIVRCMNSGMGGITDWKVGQVDGTGNIVMDYFGKYCDEALREIAEKVGAEAWIEGQTVNVCRCEHGDRITLGYDNGLTGITPDRADNVKFYTRLYPVGSSRNIDPDKYGFTRLRLPGGKKYAEVNADKYGRVDHYEDAAFADIYPRRVGEVGSVRSEVRKGEDGKPFTVYYFRDDSLTFDPNDYEIGGLVKRVSFQDGSELGGLGQEDNGTYFFEVNFNSATREFEIITIWPYDDDTQLPGGSLIPQTGDGYILWNLRMPDEYYTLAEEEFQAAVESYNEEHALDVSVFKCTTDHVWMEENGVELSVGRRVRLESREHFPEAGYRDSRITRITRKVNLPSSVDIEISDALSRSAMQKMSDSVTAVRNYTRTMVGSVGLPDIIRTGDSTRVTDNNLFSALRTRQETISKTLPDEAGETIAFRKGLTTGKYVPGISGACIDAEGNAELEKLSVRGEVSSAKMSTREVVMPGYTPGIQGGRVWIDSDGLAHVAADFLTVNRRMEVSELQVQEQTHIGGSQILSPAAMRCSRVVKIAGGWRCMWPANDADGRETGNCFAPGDLALCQTWNLQQQADGSTGNRFYWRRVTATGTTLPSVGDPRVSHYIDLSETDCAAGSCDPAGGDCIITLGSATDPARRNAIILSAAGNGSPYIYQLAGIDSYTIPASKVKTRLSPQGNIITGDLRLETTGASVAGELAALEERAASLELTAEGLRAVVAKGSANLLFPMPMTWTAWDAKGDISVTTRRQGQVAYLNERYNETSPAAGVTPFAGVFSAMVSVPEGVKLTPGEDYMVSFTMTLNGGFSQPVTMLIDISSADHTEVTATGTGYASLPEPGHTARVALRLRAAASQDWSKPRVVNFMVTVPERPADCEALSIRLEDVKLERGRVATAWTEPQQEFETRLEQTEEKIGMAVMVDGEERAGLTLDATEGMTLQADKVRVMNGDTLTALFQGGMLNAALIMARKLVAVNPAGGARVTVSEFDDPFIRFYHPDGVTLAAKVGLEEIDPDEQILGSETANAPQADGSTTAIIQCYNAAGLRRWALTLSGPVTPANQRFYWRAYALTALTTTEGGIVTQEADTAAAAELQTAPRGKECWQFVDLEKDNYDKLLSHYSGMIFSRRLTKTELESAPGRLGAKLDAGVYFSVEPHLLASSTADTPRWGRWRYTVDADGFLSAPTEFEIK